MQQRISCVRLERMEQIAVDIKKAFSYSKDSGKWYWCDSDEVHTENWNAHGPFDTRLDALKDAVEPYLHPED